MATNKQRWVGNYLGASKPLIKPGLFAAGSTKTIKRGEIIELTANGATEWVPINSDFAMNADIAVMGEEIKSGDRAGYYEIIVPRPGDLFRYDLAAAGTSIIGTSLFFSSSEKVTITAGTNILARISGNDNYPDFQGHLTDDAAGDAGTAIRSASTVTITFSHIASYFGAFDPLDS